MITKYNNFLNEKLSDKLIGFDEEGLKQQLINKKISFKTFLENYKKYGITANKDDLKKLFLAGKINETFTDFFILCNRYNIQIFSEDEIYNQIKKLSPNEMLIKAVELNFLKSIKYALNNGADIHTENDRALISSASNGYLEIVKYLVEHGADIHAKNDTSLILASDGHLNIVKYLVEHGANIHTQHDYALRLSAENGHLDIVKYLVEHGADIHAYDEQTLITSAEEGHLDIVKYLVEHGADIYALNNKNFNQEIEKFINTLW